MTETLSFRGYIKGVMYKAHLTAPLEIYSLDDFNINEAKNYGLIETGVGQIGFSKWVSPKRTRSYPFERIYNTYNSAKIITIIPVIKDEGKDGDLDKIQYSTISWMNLLNVYIVLAYYHAAEKNTRASQRHKQKITKQKFNNEFVKSQVEEIINYKQSALHWNKNLFEERFVEIFKSALAAYKRISELTRIEVHRQTSLLNYLQEVMSDYKAFASLSLTGSQRASLRELGTVHKFEHLSEGAKGQFFIENYLGGIYYLTADEVIPNSQDLILKDKKVIIQEAKNSSRGFLPSVCDIRDGLFKLILFSNLETLTYEGERIEFSCQLKLTGARVVGFLRLPCPKAEMQSFLEMNKGRYRKNDIETLEKLQAEAQQNGLRILIASNI